MVTGLVEDGGIDIVKLMEFLGVTFLRSRIQIRAAGYLLGGMEVFISMGKSSSGSGSDDTMGPRIRLC